MIDALSMFGTEYGVEFEKGEELVRQEGGRIIVQAPTKQKANALLNEFLDDRLAAKLHSFLEEILAKGSVSITAPLDFVIVGTIDGKRKRIAKLKGNTIYIRRDAIELPEEALRYIVAHELAHLFVKQHTPKFWEIVSLLYPSFPKGKDLTNTKARIP